MSLGLMLPTPVAKKFVKSPEETWLLEISGMFCCMGTPSITHSGSALPVMVLWPRIRILAASPGRPEVACTFTPASLPLSR